MAEENSPLSYQVKQETKGLDVRVAQAIADELQRPLKIVVFESKLENESSLSQEVNALLSSGVCEMASGFPLIGSDLGPPSRPTARVPDYPGAKRRPLRPWVPLGNLVPSLAYHVSAMGLVVRDPARKDATLANMGDARIGAAAGTMAGSALSLYRNGMLRSQLVSLSMREDALEQLAAGRFDATLVSLDRFDAWQLAHPGSGLLRGSYVHPLRVNIGFVALSSSTEALAAANAVIQGAITRGQLQQWSAESGSSWLAPREPQISGPLGLDSLRAE